MAFETGLSIMVFIFLGTLAGGAAVTVICKGFKKNVLYLNVFCGGILAGILGFDLVPELMSSYHPIGIMAGMSFGVFFMMLMDRILHYSKYPSNHQSDSAALLFLALLLHSIPSGLALGLNFQVEHFQVNALLMAVLFHHIPEGMVMMTAVLYAKKKMRTFWLFSFLLALAVGGNTFLGMIIDLDTLKLQTMFMGAAVGTLSYVTFFEIIWKELKNHFAINMLTVALAGIIFIKFYLLLFQIDH
ncbi:ZIP family metal transporter [Bacillus sp. J33]|uniref:ZIP family metal transporter n=1 Tax=Bacillus sp. J33 TaxID=935836 RepID=UPI0018DCA0AA|nr:ZIP family metal transporter [Bacillus sp. J33]